MNRPRSWALGAVLLIAVALLVVPAIVLAGRDSSTPVRFDNTKADSASTPGEEVRADRRDSRHDGCAKRTEPFTASSL